jgi:hypothetical protein
MLTAAVSGWVRVAMGSGVLDYGDVPEIDSRIAPRPCWWEAGAADGANTHGGQEAPEVL